MKYKQWAYLFWIFMGNMYILSALRHEVVVVPYSQLFTIWLYSDILKDINILLIKKRDDIQFYYTDLSGHAEF